MPSQKANRYGTLAEIAAARKFDLERDGVHTSWCDAVDDRGVPHEIKSAQREYSDGREGKFRIFEDLHDRLQQEGGRYVFVVYRVRGTGIQPLAFDRRPASRLPGTTWYGAGGHRGTQQRELQVSQVFG
jgi:hypothetical protein